MSTDPAENQQGATYDQQGNQLTPSPPKINLHDAASIRREQCSVYRDMRSGRVDPADGTKFIYALDAIRKAYETGIIESRMEALERTLNARKIKS